MFLPPGQRRIPPRWEPPGPGKRQGDPATVLILLIALGGILAPVGSGTVFAMVWAPRKRRREGVPTTVAPLAPTRG